MRPFTVSPGYTAEDIGRRNPQPEMAGTMGCVHEHDTNAVFVGGGFPVRVMHCETEQLED